MNKLYQQGDVLLEVVSEIPDDVNVKSDMVLAEGEVTGHKHMIDLTGIEAGLIELYEAKDGQLFVKAKTDFSVKHDEHGTITVPAGTYKVRKVREWDYQEQEVKEVRD